MSGFQKSSLLPPPSSRDMVARKEAMMNTVRSEIALANAQELINKANEKCFLKCVPKPSTSLSSSEETCLTSCLARFMEAFNIVSRTYIVRIGKERVAGSGSATSLDQYDGAKPNV